MSQKSVLHFQNVLYDYARLLANVKDVPWEKVKLIHSFCPQISSDGCYVIYPHSLDCIIALGTFYIKSGLQHTTQILPYLLELLKNISEAKWLVKADETSDLVPYAEKFTFCLNTLLSDVYSSERESIIHYQTIEIANICDNIIHELQNNFTSAEEQKLFNIKLPILLGLCFSMNRYNSSERSFFCYLFPKHKSCVGILYHLNKKYDIQHINLTALSKVILNNPQKCNHIFESCHSIFTQQDVENVMKIVQSLLSEEILNIFQEKLHLFCHQNLLSGKFFFDNLIEILKVAAVILCRDVLYLLKELPGSIKTKIKSSIEEFYFPLQKSYESNFPLSEIRKYDDIHQKLKINVLINITCLEVLTLVTDDANDAENFCWHVTKLIKTQQSQNKSLVIDAPLTIACFEVLGTIAERFPSVSDVYINILRDFLCQPSPLLTNLYKHASLYANNNDISLKRTKIHMEIVGFEYCIFKKVQNSAIENICRSLKAIYCTNPNYIPAFLTSFSGLMYVEKTRPEYSLTIENVVATLGLVSYSLPSFSKTILQCFQQWLHRQTVETDIEILHQVGDMLIFNQETEIFLDSLRILCNILIKLKSNEKEKLEYISSSFFLVLTNVSETLCDETKIKAIFIRFLEIFVQTGLDEFQNLSSPLPQDNQENLLHIIALLAKKLPNKNNFKKQQERLFQDFWLYMILRYENLINSSDPYLNLIAPKLPTLTWESITDHDLRECSYLSLISKAKISTSKHALLKTQILNFTKCPSEITTLLSRLTFSQIIYLYSFCALEIIRFENSEETTIELLFSYLTNQKLQKDKYGMWQSICKLSEDIFDRFLSVLMSKGRNDVRECILVKHAQFLLVHFNNVHPQVRHISDKFFSGLIDKFPHLLWNRQVLWSLLDIVTLLFYSVHVEDNSQITSLEVPGTTYSITLMESNKSREEILNDFVALSGEIISEANKWAETTIHIYLLEYVLQERYFYVKDEPLSHLNQSAWTLLCSNNQSNTFDIASIIASLAIRCHYKGEVCGLIEKSQVPFIEFGRALSEAVWSACMEYSFEKYESSLLRVTAFAVSQKFVQPEIKQVLASSHIRIFNKDTMSVAVHCWNWILTAHPAFEIEFLQEMFSAWQFTKNSAMGIFSVQKDNNYHSLIGSENQNEIFEVSKPHNIWIKFICHLIESVKYGNQEKLEIVVYFLHNTLSMNIDSSEYVINRSIGTIFARFSLLFSALSLLHSDVSMTCLNSVIIRQRIYCSCLDYFCCSRSFPHKIDSDLASSIKVLIKFWNALYLDKKYILKEIDRSKVLLKEDGSSFTGNTSIDEIKMIKFDNSLYSSFVHDFNKKRKLALCLLAAEIEFLFTWYNPCGQTDKLIKEGIKINEWKSEMFSVEKSIRDVVKTAWMISPVLAVFLPLRLKQDVIISEISRLILLDPAAVSHIPYAVQFLASIENVEKDSPALVHLLTWTETSTSQALSLLSSCFSPNPIIFQYALKTILNTDINSLLFYIPQLVQSLHHDPLAYMVELLKELAKKSPLFCHQLIWSLKSNMYKDCHTMQKSSIYDKLSSLLQFIINDLSGPEKVFYEREFEFVNQITEISSQIPKNLRSEERKAACVAALMKINVKPGCYLPCNPESLIYDIDYRSGTPLQSKARTPYLAKFLVSKSCFNEVNDIGLMVSKLQISGRSLDSISIQEQEMSPKEWQAAIFKTGDDVRQDILAIQIIQILADICKKIGLDVFLHPYHVVAIGPGMGVIECIPNAHSRDQLGKQTNVDLYDYFITTFGDEKSTRFQRAQKNFIKSVAAYSIISFLLQTKDRHNGNIMVDDQGHIIHIDFGFMFESSPGGNLGFEPDMKLTEEMVMIMGGKMEAEPFQCFIELCVRTYLAARNYQEYIICLVSLMLKSGLPCFRGQTIKLLRSRFSPNATDKEAAEYIITVIKNSFRNFRTVTYDMIQYFQNSIQY
ncbi:phosphatidylinositol 4-kinase alpha-like [Lycorma delicatula]|uniref:phosphatidylinositol 4-kinase alpha-like n=1 Tax=Lycorma delicatula TaxID=130591 RepID=UPI003F51A1FA